jgi:hypothetical protein
MQRLTSIAGRCQVARAAEELDAIRRRERREIQSVDAQEAIRQILGDGDILEVWWNSRRGSFLRSRDSHTQRPCWKRRTIFNNSSTRVNGVTAS